MEYDEDGKEYAKYLDSFKEPSHFHARYPFRFFLNQSRLGLPPAPKEGIQHNYGATCGWREMHNSETLLYVRMWYSKAIKVS